MKEKLTELFSYSEHPIVIFEDYYLLVLYKPAGFTVERHPTYKSLEDFAQEHEQKLFPQNKKHFIGIVHRLDVNVSGLVVMAKTRSGLKNLNQQFAEKKTRKIYLALVAGNLPEKSGRIDGWITEDKQNKIAKFYLNEVENSKTSLMSYLVLESLEKSSLVEIELETGRFHQIRASLAAIGCPIINDEKYGAKKIDESAAIKLVAVKLEFLHPKTGERMRFSLNQSYI